MANSLICDTALDKKGMAVAGFPGAEEDNPVAHQAVKFVVHYIGRKGKSYGKTITSKAKQASAKPKLVAEYAPDPLDELIAEEEAAEERRIVRRGREMLDSIIAERPGNTERGPRQRGIKDQLLAEGHAFLDGLAEEAETESELLAVVGLREELERRLRRDEPIGSYYFPKNRR